VIAAETDGLVGAAISRSPVGMTSGVDPFAHGNVREWFSFTPEPEYGRNMALVVGVAARGVSPEIRAFVRPLLGAVGPGDGGSDRAVPVGHFHAAVLPYRPLSAGAIALDETVGQLFEPGRVETILHLLGDARPIVGAGESTFPRGAIWSVPLLLERETVTT
jgi:hypothetical protein